MKEKISFAVLLLFFVMLGMTVPVSAKSYEEDGFVYRISKKQAVITDVKAVGDHLEIPASLGGFTVTRIDDRAMAREKMTKVTFPDTLQRIGYAAFQDCKKLKEVTLPGKLHRLDDRAFFGCTSLASVHFNDGLETIGNRAFSNCIALKKISLPATVKAIGDRSFEKCYKLSSVKLDKKLKSIGNQAFQKVYALKSITIPSGVKQVGDAAFSHCEDLARVKFVSGKTKLGEGVFYKCLSLKGAALPKKIKSIPASTFAGCVSIRRVTIPKQVSIIQKRAFYQCQSLKRVKLNKKIYAIGDSAFAYSGLKKLKLNARMQFIGNGAFCSTELRSLKLTSRVTFIGNRVFADCERLKTIYLPASVKGINPGAFNNCVSLQSIHVAAGNPNYSSADGVLYDKGSKKLIQYPLHKTNRSFRTPAGLQKIRDRAFAGNPYLKEVTVSAGTIGQYAFYNMESLKKVTIQNGTVKIGANAFAGNSSLSTVTLPDSVSYLGSSAFRETKICKIHIPSRLTHLGADVFYGCKKLTAFDGGRGSRYCVSEGVLYNASKTELIKYPAKKKGTVFAVPNSVKKVRSEAFEYVSNLTKIEFGKGLRTLQSNAIYGVKNLKSIVFNTKALRYGSSSAICDCGKLAVIVGPNTYTLRAMARNANATLISL